MFYVKRVEENDGIEIEEVLPSSRDEEEEGENLSSATLYQRRYLISQQPYFVENHHLPTLPYPASCVESEISFGTEFDQVFEAEVGTVPAIQSWDDTRKMQYISSACTNNGDQSSSGGLHHNSVRRNGSCRVRISSSSDGSSLVLHSESDLDHVLEEPTEDQQDTKERLITHMSMFRRRGRSASMSTNSTPLCSLMEDQTLVVEDPENNDDRNLSRGGDDILVGRESYYPKTEEYDDQELLSPRPPTSPLGVNNIMTAKINNQQFQLKMFNGSQQSVFDLKSGLDAQMSFKAKDKDNAPATTFVLTQNTISLPPLENLSSGGPIETFLGVGDFLHHLERKKDDGMISKSFTPSNRHAIIDPFVDDSAADDDFDTFGATKTRASTNRSKISDDVPVNANGNERNTAQLERTDKVLPLSADDDKSSTEPTPPEANEKETDADDGSSISTKEDDDDDDDDDLTVPGHDAERLSSTHEADFAGRLAVDVVLQAEFGSWDEVARMEGNLEASFAFDSSDLNGGGAGDRIDDLNLQLSPNSHTMEDVDPILQSRNDEESDHPEEDQFRSISEACDFGNTNDVSLHSRSTLEESRILLDPDKNETSSRAIDDCASNSELQPLKDEITVDQFSCTRDIKRSTVPIKVSIVDDEIDVEIETAEDDDSESSSTTEEEVASSTIIATPEEWKSVPSHETNYKQDEEAEEEGSFAIPNPDESSDESLFIETALSFSPQCTMDGDGFHFDEVLRSTHAVVECPTFRLLKTLAHDPHTLNDIPGILLCNEIHRSIQAVVECHYSSRLNATENGSSLLDRQQGVLFVRQTAHVMIQSKLAGVQWIGLCLLLHQKESTLPLLVDSVDGL